jgi:hypothetical protein
MTVKTGVEVVGVKEAIKGLRKIDPELRKQFNRDVKAIAAPVIDTARGNYPQMPLSGMTRTWAQGTRSLFPWSQAAARRGVSVKIDTGKRAVAAIKIRQTDPAANIYELAGKQASNPKGAAFIRNLEARFGRAQRVLWPAYERNAERVTDEMRKTVLEASRQVQKELGR